MADYSVHIQGKLTGFDKLDSIESKIKNLNSSKIKIEIDGSKIKSLESILKSLEKTKIGKISFGDTSGLDQASNKIKKIKSEMSSFKVDLNMSNANTLMSSFGNNTTKTLEKAKITLAQLKKDVSHLKLAPNDSARNEYYQKYVDGLKKYQNQMKIAKNEAKELGISLKSSSKAFSAFDAVSASNKTLTWLKNNTRATKDYGDALKELAARQKAATNSDQLTSLNKEFKSITTAAQAAGKTGNSIGSEIARGFGKIGQFVGVYGILQKGVQTARNMANAVLDVDTAMTELRKVSDASDSAINNYFTDATKTAKEYGATVSDVILATSDWSRMGYNLDQSKELARVSTLYKNIGDGIDIDAASSSLISTLQGFQLEANQAESIIDKFNQVSNNFAIGSDGIGEALKRSAAAFNAANTDLSKSIALVTGTNEVVQNPETVGNMWKTVSMRIRGTKQELEDAGEDTDGMVESTSQLRDLVQGLTGFDIMADKAGTQFKDIYDIVVGIGEQWKNLSDIEQAGLLESLAGKRQGNALAAALNNIDTIKKVYNTAEFGSDGSAMAENEKYMDSLQGKLGSLKATAQEFSNVTLDSDWLKGAVDGAQSLLEIFTKIVGIGDGAGLLGLLGTGAGITAFVKNLD